MMERTQHFSRLQIDDRGSTVASTNKYPFILVYQAYWNNDILNDIISDVGRALQTVGS